MSSSVFFSPDEPTAARVAEKLSDQSASTVKTTQSTSGGFLSDDRKTEVSKDKWNSFQEFWLHVDERWSEKQMPLMCFLSV